MSESYEPCAVCGTLLRHECKGPGGEQNAIQVMARDVAAWKQRAEAAESKLAAFKCACVAGQWCHKCDPCARHRERVRELEAKLAALVSLLTTEDDGPEGPMGARWILGQAREMVRGWK